MNAVMQEFEVTAWKFHLSVLEALFTPRARHSGKDVTERAGLQISCQSLHERDGEVGKSCKLGNSSVFCQESLKGALCFQCRTGLYLHHSFPVVANLVFFSLLGTAVPNR